MTDQPTDPSDATEPSAADARWFRDAVDPVLDARPVPDGWPAIRDQATGAAPSVVALSAPGRSARTTRWLLAAAVVALLAAVGGMVVATRGGDDSTGLAVEGPDGEDGPTGFYLPTDLPPGWEVVAFNELADATQVELCPCERGTWREKDRTFTVYRVNGEIGSDSEGFEAWTGAPGGRRAVLPGGTVSYEWRSDGSATFVQAFGFDDPAEADDLVAQWVGADLTGPAGWEELDRARAGGDIRGVHQASGLLGNEDLDLVVPFLLSPDTGFLAGPDATALANAPGAEPVPLPGSGRTLYPVEGSDPPGFVGAWPGGARFQIGSGLREGATSDGVTREQVLALAAAFQPASAAEWKRFVGEVDTTGKDSREVDLMRRTLIHPTIDGLVVREGDEVPDGGDDPVDGVDPRPEDHVDPPRSTLPAGEPRRPLPTAPEADEPGSPAVADPVDTLAVETDPATVSVASGDPFTIAVTITNRTDRPVSVDSCFPGGASWTLEQDGRPVGPTGAYTLDCGGQRPGLVEPGAIRSLRPAGNESFTFATADGGQQVPPGRYEAVIRVVDIDDPVRVPVLITP